MSEKRYTERDLILAKRAAYRDAAGCSDKDCVLCRDRVVELYPIPMVTRRRVVVDPSGDYIGYWSYDTERDGIRWHRRAYSAGEPWMVFRDDPARFAPLPLRVALWADLIANPTETVEDDDRGSTPTG